MAAALESAIGKQHAVRRNNQVQASLLGTLKPTWIRSCVHPSVSQVVSVDPRNYLESAQQDRSAPSAAVR